MDKFEIRVQKKKAPLKFKPVQLYEETHKLIESIIEVTNGSKAQTIHEMLMFAYENMQIVKEEDEQNANIQRTKILEK